MLNKNNERALVYLANVSNITPLTFMNTEGVLEEASNVEILETLGWKAVVLKNRFKVNELFVYVEYDTILPKDIPLFSFLEGKRIKTKKLKGVVSQGVCFTIPEILDVVYNLGEEKQDNRYASVPQNMNEGDDWTELVGATKYDEYSTEKAGNNALKQMPADVRGKFPSFIPKTDEERIQNLTKELKYDWVGKKVIAREKVHGCLDENTLISTHKGGVTIKEICENPKNYKLATYNVETHKLELENISNALIQENISNWYEVELENGTILKITNEHQVWLPELNCYRKVENLAIGDNLLVRN